MMKKSGIVFAAFVSALVSFPAAAQARFELQPPSQPEEIRLYNPMHVRYACEAFLDSALEGEWDDAFAFLSDIPGMIGAEQLENLKNQAMDQTERIASVYGEALDYLLVREENAGNAAYRLTYAMRYEYHPIRWEFIFYNPYDDGWYLNSVRYDDTIESLFTVR